LGFHTCEYCRADGVPPATSSGETTITFMNGRSYNVPDMLPHYVLEHNYRPPEQFIEDVMGQTLALGNRLQSKSPATPVGWLSGDDYPRWDEFMKAGAFYFLSSLVRILRVASHHGAHLQTRGG
jgi:hypothetical protein